MFDLDNETIRIIAMFLYGFIMGVIIERMRNDSNQRKNRPNGR